MEPNGSATDILKSERGVITLVILIAATVLVGLDKMPIELWMQTSLGIGGIYMIGKSATGYAEAQARGRVAAIQEAAKTGAVVPAEPGTSSAPVTNIINQPASAPVVDAAGGVAVSRTTSRGSIRSHVMLCITLIGLMLAMAANAGCSDANRAAFGKVAGDVVDCTTPGAKDLVKQWSPVLDQILTRATTNDGRVDWNSVKESAQNFALDAGGCVLATVVKRAIDGTRNPDAPQSAPLSLDKADLRAGFEQLRRDVLGGKRYKTEAGEL